MLVQPLRHEDTKELIFIKKIKSSCLDGFVTKQFTARGGQ